MTLHQLWPWVIASGFVGLFGVSKRSMASRVPESTIGFTSKQVALKNHLWPPIFSFSVLVVIHKVGITDVLAALL